MADLAVFERVKEIIQDQVALERHQREHGAGYDEIEFSRVDAYRQIVRVVMGFDIFIGIAASERV